MSEEKNYKITRVSYPSSDGKNTVAGYFCEPEGEQKLLGVVQINHGMREYFLRYEQFAAYLCANGYAVCGNDHLGHGYTAACDDDLGFTAEGGGSAYMVKDAHRMTRFARERYGEDIPLILMGHSMGSFIARLCLSNFGEDYDAAIIMGTAGTGSPHKAGKAIATMIMEAKGERHRSKMLEKVTFAGYNLRYQGKTHAHSWLTRDDEAIQKYADDKFCNYTFTARAFYDLYDLLEGVSKVDWSKRVPKSIPYLLISGDMDPVGDYGNGVKAVYNRLCEAGIYNMELKLYRDHRHEVLNELGREQVYEDILDWLEEAVE